MAEVTTVKQLAEDVGIPVETLIKQLQEALQDRTLKSLDADQVISGQQKQKLLDYLKKTHGHTTDKEAAGKITLKRTKKMEVQGRSTKVNVVVRKKRTYAKRVVKPEEVIAEEPKLEPEAIPAPLESAPEVPVETPSPEPTELESQPTEIMSETPAVEEKAHAETPEVETSAEEASSKDKSKLKDKKAKVAKPAEKTAESDETGKRRDALPSKKGRDDKEKWRLTGSGKNLAKTFSGEEVLDEQRPTRRKRKRKGSEKEGLQQHGFAKPVAPMVREVTIPETITVAELAQRMAVKGGEVIKTMMKMGAMATINQVLDQDTAVLIVEEMGHKPKVLKGNAAEVSLEEDLKAYSGEKHARAPVVTIMGHVDHGKTSLLDYIRRTRVTAGEAGGITQHIGAYSVQTDKGKITFLDTPGHAAFTAMRARGANCTDIVILVVAADDGVMPQTIEAVQHAKAANVPVIVAVNKIDKPEADSERVKSELANYEVIPEEWGGENMFVPVSAKTGEGIDQLLDSILVQSEVLELEAHDKGPAQGVIIESRLDKGRGPVATLLIQQGQLEKGQVVLTGFQFGRIRAMLDETGKQLDSAGPSTPVEILGLSGPANAGDTFAVVKDERKAREIALFRQGKFREVKLAKQKAASLENIFDNVGKAERLTLNIVLKTDVQGSLEALRDSLNKLSTPEISLNIIGSGVGGINESDVNLALASNAIMIAFNVRADAGARKIIEDEQVTVNYFSIIYEVIDTVKAAMSGMLSPEIKEKIVGLAEVRDVFRSAKFGSIAGCMVKEGVIKRNNPIRVLRDNVVIYEGALESLRRFKEDVNEVRSGTECGIGVKNYNDVKPGDQIEVYERIEVARTL